MGGSCRGPLGVIVTVTKSYVKKTFRETSTGGPVGNVDHKETSPIPQETPGTPNRSQQSPEDPIVKESRLKNMITLR